MVQNFTCTERIGLSRKEGAEMMPDFNETQYQLDSAKTGGFSRAALSQAFTPATPDLHRGLPARRAGC